MGRPLYDICIHESGHAVVALAIGVRVLDISCRGSVADDGRRLAGHATLASCRPWHLLIAACGGGIAEQKVGGKDRKCNALDEEISWQLATQIGRENRMPPTVIFAQAWAIAGSLLNRPRLWRAVQAVAAKLQVVGVLDGDEVGRIYSSALEAR